MHLLYPRLTKEFKELQQLYQKPPFHELAVLEYKSFCELAHCKDDWILGKSSPPLPGTKNSLSSNTCMSTESTT